MSLDLGTLRGFLELDDTGVDKGIDSAKGKIQDFATSGKGLATIAGGAIAGALTASLVKGMNVEAANDKLAGQLALSEKESARIGKAAGELYASNYGDSLEGVNDAIKSVVQNIDGMKKASNADLEDVTKKVLNLSSTFEQDLGMTTAAVGQMMRTGMVKDAGEALDILTVGLQGPANKADDLMETFNEYGTQFRKVGLDGQTAMGLLQQGMKGGARDADIVADSIKEFSIRSQEAIEQMDSKGRPQLTELGSAFQNLGLDGYKMQEAIGKGGPGASKALDTVLDRLRKVEDPTTRATTAVALFGTQAEDMGDALYKLDPSKAVDSLGKVSGAAEKMDKTLNDNAVASLESLKRQAEVAFGSLMNWALPVVNDLTKSLADGFGPALEKIVDVGGKVAGFFKEHETLSKTLAVTIGALVVVTQLHAAVLAVQAAGGLVKYLQATKLVTAVTKVWTAVQWAMNAALSANPIGIVIVVLAALVAALIVAYKKSETFRDVVKTVTNAVGDAWRWLWNSVLQPVFKLLVSGIAWIMDKFGDMLDAMSHVPGFGWAKTAADAMHNAADKARELGDSIKKIPPRKDVYVTFHETTIRSILNRNANDRRLNLPEGATGGIVTRPTLAIIGEAGPEAVVPLNRTPGSRPLPGDLGTGGRAAPLIGTLTVPAMPGSTDDDVHRVVGAVVYQVGLAQRSGRWA